VPLLIGSLQSFCSQKQNESSYCLNICTWPPVLFDEKYGIYIRPSSAEHFRLDGRFIASSLGYLIGTPHIFPLLLLCSVRLLMYSQFSCCDLRGEPFFNSLGDFLLLSWPSSESDSALLLLVHTGTNLLPDSQQLHSCTSSLYIVYKSRISAA
jgi:hypothetical protein